jgi:hypothetical protein
MEKITVINKDAQVPVAFGTEFIFRLQKLFAFLVSNISEEELKEYKAQSESGQPFTEDWMDHLTTVSFLLIKIEEEAKAHNMTTEEDLYESDSTAK